MKKKLLLVLSVLGIIAIVSGVSLALFKGWFGGTQVSSSTTIPYNAISKTYNVYAHWTKN